MTSALVAPILPAWPQKARPELDIAPQQAGWTRSGWAVRCFEKAFASEERDELEQALQECELAIELDPNLADAHNLRGIILEQIGRKEEAILAYRESTRLAPDFQQARENLQDLEAELKEARLESQYDPTLLVNQ